MCFLRQISCSRALTDALPLPSGLAFLQGVDSDAPRALPDSAPSPGCRDQVLLASLCLWLGRGWVHGEAEL